MKKSLISLAALAATSMMAARREMDNKFFNGAGTSIGPESLQDGGGTNAGVPKKLTGFAAMDPERQREIASKGGKAVHQSGNAHRYTSETGRKAALRKKASLAS